MSRLIYQDSCFSQSVGGCLICRYIFNCLHRCGKALCDQPRLNLGPFCDLRWLASAGYTGVYCLALTNRKKECPEFTLIQLVYACLFTVLRVQIGKHAKSDYKRQWRYPLKQSPWKLKARFLIFQFHVTLPYFRSGALKLCLLEENGVGNKIRALNQTLQQFLHVMAKVL